MTTLWSSITSLFARLTRKQRVGPPEPEAEPVRSTGDPKREGAQVVSDKLTHVKRTRKQRRKKLRTTFSGHGPMASAAQEVRAGLAQGDANPFEPSGGLTADAEKEDLLSETAARLRELRTGLKDADAVAALRTLSEAVARKRLDLPRLPDVAQELMTIDVGTELSFEELAKKVEKDQDLSARVLQVANSPIYTRTELDSLERAVAALGLPTFRNVVLGAVSDAAIYKVPGFDRYVAIERTRALKAQRIAAAFAKEQFGRSAAGVASLAGLLHDAGKVLVLRNLSIATRRADGGRSKLPDALVQRMMEELHVPLGLYYARLRGLPRSVRVGMAHDTRMQGVHTADREVALPVAVAAAVVDSGLPGGSPIQARKVAEALCLEDPGVVDAIQRAATPVSV